MSDHRRATAFDETYLRKLRQRAETYLRKAQPRSERSKTLSEQLAEEVDLHLAELRIQNEELRRAQAELRESHDRYLDLYENSPVGFLTLDRIGRIVHSNQRATEIFRAEDLTRRALASFLSEDDAETLHRYLADIHDGTATGGTELAMTRGDGSALQAQLLAIPRTAPDGRPEVRCAVMDVTVQRAAVREATRHRRISAAVLDTARDAIVELDEALRIQSVNPAAERLFGYDSEHMEGASISLLLPDIMPEALGALPTGRARTLRARHENGARIPVEVQVGTWEQEGRPRRTVLFHDISERASQEARVQESEERLRQLAEHIDDVFLIYEREGFVSYVSPNYQRVLGHPPPEQSAGPAQWLGPTHPDDRDRVVEAFQTVLAGRSVEEDFRIVRADGRTAWLRGRAYPVRNETGELHRVVAVAQDITQARVLQEELRHAQKMDAIGTLAAGLAHDLNNVLMGVVGCVNLAQHEELTDAASALMRQAERSARSGASLITRLLAFGRRDVIAPRATELDDAVSQVAPLLTRLVGEHVRVELHLDAPAAHVHADPVQIDQVLMNLAANARDAMPEGGVLTIETTTSDHESDGPFLKLVVRDTGVGMDNATRERIFEPFFTTKEVGLGTGLGLSTVFAVTKQLGGRVKVESSPGEGTAFTLLLPRVSAPSESERPSRPECRFRGSALLVEDDAIVRMTVARYLKDLGFDVAEAANGEEALRVCELREAPIDLLVSDVMMPLGTGPALARLLTRDHPDMATVLISAHPHSILLAEGRVDEESIVLQKPFGRGELCATLSSLLEPRTSTPPPPHGRAIVAEDDPISRRAVGELLEEMGFEVSFASSPDEATELIDRLRGVHLVVTDLDLAGLSGIDVAERIRERSPGVPVIIMSGAAQPPLIADATFLPKPFVADELRRAVEDALEPEPARAG